MWCRHGDAASSHSVWNTQLTSKVQSHKGQGYGHRGWLYKNGFADEDSSQALGYFAENATDLLKAIRQCVLK